MTQWVLSLIPWWLYAICAVAAYVAARRYLGEKIALGYAIAAAAWVAMDYGGDRREAWVRSEWSASVDRARAAIAADDREAARIAKASDAELAEILAHEATKRAEIYDALRQRVDDGSCTVQPYDADRLQPGGRP